MSLKSIGKLRTKKALDLPNLEFALQGLTEQDIADLAFVFSVRECRGKILRAATRRYRRPAA